MARRLRIKWAAGQAVDGLVEVPKLASGPGVLLAHGAGAGQRHPFMVHIRRGLAAAGIVTMTFDYSYTDAGRRAPDRLEKLLAVHAAAADRLKTYCDDVVLAGKSMGGRVGSHLAGDTGWQARGLVYYAYPLVAIGKSEPRPTNHLARIGVPQLFFAGTRDRMSPVALMAPLADRLTDAALIVVDGGDHSFNVPKRLGAAPGAILDQLVASTVDWIAEISVKRS